MVAMRIRLSVFSRKFHGALAMLVLALASSLSAQTTYTGTVKFGTASVGTPPPTHTITFNFSSPTALNVAKPVQILTTGAANLDFKNAGTGTCGPSTYSTCTVDVTFTPTAPGLRSGAVVLEDLSGNVLSTVYINGIGQGPAIAYSPFTQTNIALEKTIPRA